jgi:hypothetical protein
MIAGTKENLVRFFQGLGFAYNRVFARENRFTELVLEDLAKFCRAHETSFHPDPRVHAQLEGRREVWLRIEEFLHLSPEEIVKLRVRITQNERNQRLERNRSDGQAEREAGS